MRTKVFAVLVAASAVTTAGAADVERIGRFRPSLDASFHGGLTDEHNSVGMAVGTSVALAQFGPVQFPVVGADVGLTSVCRADGESVVPGANDPCGSHLNGFAQIKGGLGIRFGDQRDSANRVFSDLSLVVTPTYLVAGPFKGNAGLNIGIRFRWRETR